MWESVRRRIWYEEASLVFFPMQWQRGKGGACEGKGREGKGKDGKVLLVLRANKKYRNASIE